MSIRSITPAAVPTAAACYSPAVLAEGSRLLFISGQGPRDLNADMETQIRDTFQQIALVLEEAQGSMSNLVMIRAYFLNMARDLPLFRKVRQEFLEAPYPAATAVGVSELAVEDLQIEIEAVAIL